MHQRKLLEETEDYLRPSEKKITGIEYHQKYSESIRWISLILFVGIAVHYWLFGITTAALFGVVIFAFGLFIELYLRIKYDFTGRDAVKYYAIELYKEPTPEKVHQLQSWNKNPFDLTTEYYYPQIGELIKISTEREDTLEYIQKNLPDTLRLIERSERDDYNTLIDISNFEEYKLDEYYVHLIQEINYSYKFGGYTSSSILIRKLAENLMRDILMAKGLIDKLPNEPGFQDVAELLHTEVLQNQLNPETAEELEESLQMWIRRKGNKGAHIPEDFKRSEIQDLMTHSQKAIRILVVIRADALSD